MEKTKKFSRRGIKDIDILGKRVLIRCDFNVPLDEAGNITDDFRIRESIPTIEYALGQKAKVILLAHLGRPAEEKGGDSEARKKLSLQPVASSLSAQLSMPVPLLADCVGENIKQEIDKMEFETVVLLENLRFHKEEEANVEAFAKEMASLGDIYINEAFAVDHRAHASLVGIPKHLPSAMGLLLEKEVHALEKVSNRPEKPLVVLVGGAKVETKASFLKAISKNADAILLGDLITKEVREKGVDVSDGVELVYALDGIDGTFDLGPKTIQAFEEKIQLAKTIFWAGPLGMIEKEKYEKGSVAIAQAIIKSGAFSVAGGGDLAAFLNKHKLREKFSHVSTGGGAMLAFLAGETLPGLKALE